MLTTAISRATAPHLPWAARTPGLAAILAQALRSGGKASRGYRYPRPQPVPFTGL